MRYVDWKAKALLQKALSRLPYGESVNFWLQLRITHGLPISDDLFKSHFELARAHVGNFERFGGRPVAAATFYEFGGGWDLAMALMLSSLGVRNQIVVDIKRLARAELMLDIVNRIGGSRPPEGSSPPEGTDVAAALLRGRGIDYRAPLDARRTSLDAGSVDCVTSTNTLEHIPPDDIRLLLKECHRILRDDGVASFQIDYNDHYSYFDGELPHYHFLRYSDKAWKRFNSSIHYQSRLRHSEYVHIIESCGFLIIDETVQHGSDQDLEAIAGFPLAPRFQTYDRADLVAHSSILVLRKHGAQSLA